jgi:hypothetical protein
MINERYQKVSKGIKRYQKLTKGIKRYQKVSKGIKRYQKESQGIKSRVLQELNFFPYFEVKGFILYWENETQT